MKLVSKNDHNARYTNIQIKNFHRHKKSDLASDFERMKIEKKKSIKECISIRDTTCIDENMYIKHDMHDAWTWSD